MRVAACLLLTCAFLGPTDVAAAHPPRLAATCVPGRKSANLQQTLESGLRARRPEEFDFIERVVIMVNQKKLPETLVRSTFDWARDKRPYPYPYFERGLKVRAARLGITVR